MAEEIKNTTTTEEVDSNPKETGEEEQSAKTFTEEEVAEIVKQKVEEATRPLLSKIQELDQKTFNLMLTKENLNLNDTQLKVLKKYCEDQEYSDINFMVDAAKELFGSSNQETLDPDKDFEETFAGAADTNALRKN